MSSSGSDGEDDENKEALLSLLYYNVDGIAQKHISDVSAVKKLEEEVERRQDGVDASTHSDIRDNSKGVKRGVNREKRYFRENKADVCFRCGGSGHFAKECPQKLEKKEVLCFYCNKKGHTSRECPKLIRREFVRSDKLRPNICCYNCGYSVHTGENCDKTGVSECLKTFRNTGKYYKNNKKRRKRITAKKEQEDYIESEFD